MSENAHLASSATVGSPCCRRRRTGLPSWLQARSSTVIGKQARCCRTCATRAVSPASSCNQRPAPWHTLQAVLVLFLEQQGHTALHSGLAKGRWDVSVASCVIARPSPKRSLRLDTCCTAMLS